LLGGADLSWLVGIVVAGGVYLVVSRTALRPPCRAPPAAHADKSAGSAECLGSVHADAH